MATIDSLPPELLCKIMEHIFSEWQTWNLCDASLVCQKWREPAQRVLLRNVVPALSGSAEVWLQSEGRYRVESLSILWEWFEGSLPMKLLRACPNLRSLWLNGDYDDGGYEWCTSVHAEDDECAPALIACLSAKPFPLVRRLVLEDATGYEFWPKLLPSFPPLLTLELNGHAIDGGTVESVAAVGASVVATLRNLIFTKIKMDEDELAELLRIIKLPNLAGLRRLEISMTPKDAFAGKAGLALLDECEKRSISLLCRYGWLTRDMMREDASSPQGN
ncbi:hypothetical protein RQP46_010248 [Phenoliferia psychrophenolica]